MCESGTFGIFLCVYALGFVIGIGILLLAYPVLFTHATKCRLRNEKDPVLSFVTSPLGIVTTFIMVAFGSWISVILFILFLVVLMIKNIKNITKGMC